MAPWCAAVPSMQFTTLVWQSHSSTTGESKFPLNSKAMLAQWAQLVQLVKIVQHARLVQSDKLFSNSRRNFIANNIILVCIYVVI